MITLHQLRTFLAVARAGNITKAARELKAKQPTVSLQLRTLRRFLGMPLFERPGGQFRLTAAGERLKRYAEDAIAGLRSLEQDVGLLKASAARRRQGGLVGPLNVGLTYVISRYVMSALLSRFLEHYPGVEMHLMVDVPEPLFDALLRNSLDVACLMNTFVPSGLTAESLCDEELVIFASPRHPLAGRRRIGPDELSRHPFVASTSPALRAHIDNKLRIARRHAAHRRGDASPRRHEEPGRAGLRLLDGSALRGRRRAGAWTARRAAAPGTADHRGPRGGVPDASQRPLGCPAIHRFHTRATAEPQASLRRPSTPRTDAAPMGRPRARPRRGSGVSGRPRKAGTRS